ALALLLPTFLKLRLFWLALWLPVFTPLLTPDWLFWAALPLPTPLPIGTTVMSVLPLLLPVPCANPKSGQTASPASAKAPLIAITIVRFISIPLLLARIEVTQPQKHHNISAISGVHTS